MKMNYESPRLEVVEIEIEGALLQASLGDFSDDSAFGSSLNFLNPWNN